MLSQKQERILNFLRRFEDEKGYPPTIRDILRGCNISSTSVVDYNLNILEREGRIRRDREVSRGIELMGKGRRLALVPIIGRIAAGEPIPTPTPETWNTIATSEALELTEELVQGKEEVYALRVKGTSMIDALIGDGDIILMEQANTAENGDMVAVWLKDRGEVTLKRFYYEGERVRLQPANEEMKPIYSEPGNVEIQGKVIAVIRRLE
jgi:repressor LexA